MSVLDACGPGTACRQRPPLSVSRQDPESDR